MPEISLSPEEKACKIKFKINKSCCLDEKAKGAIIKVEKQKNVRIRSQKQITKRKTINRWENKAREHAQKLKESLNYQIDT